MFPVARFEFVVVDPAVVLVVEVAGFVVDLAGSTEALFAVEVASDPPVVTGLPGRQTGSP